MGQIGCDGWGFCAVAKPTSGGGLWHRPVWKRLSHQNTHLLGTALKKLMAVKQGLNFPAEVRNGVI